MRAGVTVSYFEWSQNIQQFRWTLEGVNQELDDTMRQSLWRRCHGWLTSSGLDLRTAAFVLAIKRVARAAASRRTISKHLPASLLD